MYDITFFNFTIGKYREQPVSVPVNCLILIKVLEDKGFSAEFFDYKLNDFKDETSIDNVVRFFKQAKSDIICISSMSQGLPFLVLAIRKIKRECPDKIFILGGVGPTSAGKLLLECCREIDFIVMHEGETTLPELVSTIKKGGDLKRVKGIIFRTNNQIVMTEKREREENIDIIPAYHKINFKHYNQMPTLTSRGCPYNCSFCYNKPFWGPKITFRSIKNVFEEIDIIKDHFNYIVFADDLFICDRKRVNEFLDIYKKGKYSFEWGFSGRVNLMTEELMKTTSKLNCTGVFYGAESGSDKILKSIGKNFTSRDLRKVLTLSNKYYQDSIAVFIYGWPSETWNDFMKTIKLMEFCGKKPHLTTGTYQLAPLYGTKIFFENREKISFSEENLSSLEKSSGLALGKEIVSLIKSNKDLFSSYYQVPSALLEQKQQLIDLYIQKTREENGIK